LSCSRCMNQVSDFPRVRVVSVEDVDLQTLPKKALDVLPNPYRCDSYSVALHLRDDQQTLKYSNSKPVPSSVLTALRLHVGGYRTDTKAAVSRARAFQYTDITTQQAWRGDSVRCSEQGDELVVSLSVANSEAARQTALKVMVDEIKSALTKLVGQTIESTQLEALWKSTQCLRLAKAHDSDTSEAPWYELRIEGRAPQGAFAYIITEHGVVLRMQLVCLYGNRNTTTTARA
jgi:hypothetical protein